MRPNQVIFALPLIALAFPHASFGDEPRKAPQYRYRGESIPAAESGEPRANELSSLAVRKHLQLGAVLWSKQKKCFSCHTHGVYMITRPSMTSVWGEPSPALREFVVKQSNDLIQSGDVNASNPTKMAYLARGLAEWDAQFNDKASPETDAAIRHLLMVMQADDGSIRANYRWPPINSDTYHATIMAVMAVATAPGWREQLEDKRLEKRIESLESFLRTTRPQHDHQRLLLLWASTRVPGLLDAQRKREFIARIWKRQLADGGWSVYAFADPRSLGGGRRSEKLAETDEFKSPSADGYQTGLAVVVLRDAGVAADDPRIRKAVDWLTSHQRKSGRWWTRSLNVDSRFHYISFSGTAYAALALAKCNALPKAP